jgi:hypothetical protein
VPAVDRRLAISPNTYIDRFGSWLSALSAAVVLDEVSFEAFRLLVRSARDFSEDELLETLRRADRGAGVSTGVSSRLPCSSVSAESPSGRIGPNVGLRRSRLRP